MTELTSSILFSVSPNKYLLGAYSVTESIAPDKQIEKRHALWPKFQASRGFRQAVEEHIGLVPKKKSAKTEHTLQKRTYSIPILCGKKINHTGN